MARCWLSVDIVFDFGSIWRYMNNAGFVFMHPSSATNVDSITATEVNQQ